MATRRTALGFAALAAAYGGYRLYANHARRYKLAGRTVLITGGARGLGLVLARELVQQGAHVAICSRHGDEVRRAVAELSTGGQNVIGERCDVTDPAQFDQFLAAVRRDLGPVDVLINNAGVIQVGPLEAMTEQDFDDAMRIHFYAPLHAMMMVAPEMRRRGHGRIINISSIGGQISVPHLLPYCASKYALVGLSQGFRAECARDGVYVTTVCPGLMRTGSHWRAWFKGRHRKEHAWFSLGASAPLLAMSSERAARQILAACAVGRAQITLSLPAKLVARLNSLAPDLVADASSAVARILPGPGGVGAQAIEGRHSGSAWSPSLGTILGDRAAVRNNEIDGLP